MEQLITITALGDNYIYLYRYDKDNAFVIDPGDAKAVLNTLEKHNLNLTHALATHHHFDHIGGIRELKKSTGCNVIIANETPVFKIPGINIQIIATPGHTQDSICYYVQPANKHNGILFTGDTLFIGGDAHMNNSVQT